jgi:hypothetical protein
MHLHPVKSFDFPGSAHRCLSRAWSNCGAQSQRSLRSRPQQLVPRAAPNLQEFDERAEVVDAVVGCVAAISSSRATLVA